jgi:hypothetical protein
MSYAWIIDVDHLADSPKESEAGITGPRDAPDWMVDILNENNYVGLPGVVQGEKEIAQIYTFKMHDDDNILYYTGRMITDEGDTEEACSAPLLNFGMPNAGAVSVRYPGHADMDCS